MFIYRLLAASALLAYSPFALLRSLTGRRKLGDLKGRLGWRSYPDLAGGVWIHAVSVGEVGVAKNLAKAIASRAPERRLGLSVTTAAGRETAMRAGDFEVFAFPFDLASPVEKALTRVRPGLVLLTETELWPLFLERTGKRGIPVALVNGRISKRSYPRYRVVRGWFSKVLDRVALFAMQTDADAERIASLGARPARIRVTGNIKYDLEPAPPFPDREKLLKAAAGLPLVVAASTGEGEEEIVLEAWRKLTPRPFLAVAPRRPERFGEVARLIEAAGYRLITRGGAFRADAEVYLLDSIGELASLYSEAAVAFLGGSLIPTGGHNPIEAWRSGVFVLTGPHTENFAEVTQHGEQMGILRRVADGEKLREAMQKALSDPWETSEKGARAERFVSENRGAAAATAEFVLPLLRSLSD